MSITCKDIASILKAYPKFKKKLVDLKHSLDPNAQHKPLPKKPHRKRHVPKIKQHAESPLAKQAQEFAKQEARRLYDLRTDLENTHILLKNDRANLKNDSKIADLEKKLIKSESEHLNLLRRDIAKDIKDDIAKDIKEPKKTINDYKPEVKLRKTREPQKITIANRNVRLTKDGKPYKTDLKATKKHPEIILQSVPKTEYVANVNQAASVLDKDKNDEPIVSELIDDIDGPPESSTSKIVDVVKPTSTLLSPTASSLQKQVKSPIKGSGNQNKGLYDDQINKYMSQVKGFKGTFMADEFGHINSKHGSLISNTDPAYDDDGNPNEGTHWVALWWDVRHMHEHPIHDLYTIPKPYTQPYGFFYYDPFGNPPSEGIVMSIKQLADNITDNIELPFFQYNKCKYQAEKSYECGYFCMAWIIDMTNGYYTQARDEYCACYEDNEAIDGREPLHTVHFEKELKPFEKDFKDNIIPVHEIFS